MAGALLLAAALSSPAEGQQSPASDAASPSTHPWQMLEERCAKCHNTVDWAGGIAFDTLTPENVAADAEVWEKAVRKLRGRMMPPPGQEQPAQHTIDEFVAWLESRLDAAPAADPGHVGLHRLNRTEYAREIERILGLEVDVKTLLPKDVSTTSPRYCASRPRSWSNTSARRAT
jgi:hypothetical protein